MMRHEKLKQVNPNNFFGLRRLKYQAPHLHYVDVPFNYNLEKALVKWIEYNLKHRFYLNKTVGISPREDTALEYKFKVGFEDPKELSYFILACPLLKYK